MKKNKKNSKNKSYGRGRKNIDRFTAFLQDKAADSQFVMISHRQSTMEAADALWGVTMEEEGVSKVIGVRLTAAGAEPAAEE